MLDCQENVNVKKLGGGQMMFSTLDLSVYRVFSLPGEQY